MNDKNLRLSFRFLSDLLGGKVVAAEVDNLGQSVTLRMQRNDQAHVDFVAPAVENINELEDLFVAMRCHYGAPAMLMLKRDVKVAP